MKVKIRTPRGLKPKYYEYPPKPLEKSKLIRATKKYSTNDEFNSIIICGKKGRGKSTLAMWLSYHIYQDWKRVLDRIEYDPISISNMLNDALMKDYIIPAIIWDDAAAYGSYDPNTYYSPVMKALKGAYETVRVSCPLMIFTAASPKRLAPFLREDVSVIVKVRKKGLAHVFRVIDVLKWNDPLNMILVLKWEENVSFGAIPEDVYSKYSKMRKEMLRKFTKFMKEYESLLTPSEFAAMVNESPARIRALIKLGVIKEGVINAFGEYRIKYDIALKEYNEWKEKEDIITWISTSALASMVGCDRTTINKWIDRGIISRKHILETHGKYYLAYPLVLLDLLVNKKIGPEDVRKILNEC